MIRSYFLQNKITQYFYRSEGLKFSLLTISSYLLASFLAAITTIVISRFLGPSNFALFSTATALSIIISQLNNFGLSTVIQKYVGGSWQQQKINRFLSICMRYRLLLSVFITTLALLFSQNLADFFQLDQRSLIQITILCSLAPTYLDSGQVTLQSLAKFKLAAFNYLLPAILKLSLALAIAFLHLQKIELILALYLLSTIPSVLIAELGKPSWVKYDLFHKFPKEEALTSALLKHSAFAVIAAGFIENSDLLLAKHYLSNYETGLLAGVGRIAMILAVVAVSLSNVLFPRVAKYRDRHNLGRFLKKALLLSFFSIVVLTLLIPLSPYLINWTIGSDYLPAVLILKILLIAGTANVMVVFFSASFYAFNNNRYFSLAALLQLLIIILGNVLYVPQYGLLASALTRLLAKLVLLIFTLLMLLFNWHKEFSKTK